MRGDRWKSKHHLETKRIINFGSSGVPSDVASSDSHFPSMFTVVIIIISSSSSSMTVESLQ